jgi:arylsulfatase
MIKPPNILFIMADQFRADALGAAGGPARTPALDKLARDGLLFENAFTNSPECVPARFSLATGLYPHQTGVWANGMFALNPRCPNWMRLVRSEGYRTALFGKTHLHPHRGDLRDRVHLLHAYGLQTVDEICGPRANAEVLSNMTASWRDRGLWDAYRTDLADRYVSDPVVARPSVLGLEDYYDVYVGGRAREYLESLGRDAPWLCWVSFAGPHEPWDAPEPYASMYRPADMPPALPRISDWQSLGGQLDRVGNLAKYSPPLTDDAVRRLRANYAGNVTLIDDQIAALFDVLHRRGEYDDTLIVFTSDHGEMNGDHGLIYKANFLDPILKIPLIVKPPGHAGRAEPAITELMDVGATLADYAGASAKLGHARSLRPLIERSAATHRDSAIAEFRGNVALVTQRWKAEFDSGRRLVLLIDRLSDPLEQNNIAEDDDGSVFAALWPHVAAFMTGTPPPSVAAVLPDLP